MCSAPVGPGPGLPNPSLLEIAADFAASEKRAEAAARLAHSLGAEQLHLFSPDPELGVLLPAPGMPQRLPQASEWRPFLAACVREGAHAGHLPTCDGEPLPAIGVSEGGAVAVLTGPEISLPAAERLRPVIRLLGALFTGERTLAAAEMRTRAAGEAMERQRLLTRSLDEMRVRLEQALRDADEARREARERAQHAEMLAAELQTQAAHLTEQATELEVLNEVLALRTGEAEKARQLADEANRAKSEFLANMSHELRTPINAVLGFEELLTMEIAGPLNEAQRSQLERIRSSSRHLLTLINDILDLAKVEAGQLSIVHDFETLEPVVEEAISLVRLQYEDRGLRLEHACPTPTPVYYGDPNRVRQILLNLLSNALKFTEPGGSVTVNCGTTDRPPREARLSGSRSWTYVEIQDTGIGISPADAAKIFKPFGQVEEGRTRRQGGTGLGLTISRQLARLMGGALTLESEPGAGSRFILWLPVDNPVHGELDGSIRVPEGGEG